MADEQPADSAPSPTNPNGPQTATTAPDHQRHGHEKQEPSSADVTPRLKAKSSPVVSRFSSCIKYQTIRRRPPRREGRNRRRPSDDAFQPAHHPPQHAERAGEFAHVLQEEDQAGEEELTATPASSIVAVTTPAGCRPSAVDQNDRKPGAEQGRERHAREPAW